ncbi:unnamed protein product [Caenorhabditis angaria]|uniref:Uncharacterized protein n=1 Tax=Caenorhabditis angaria TaxID=860376 RepID=A0A9P1N784_9PELO|nr:unnamed protein product [Caenorhabditis angaria]
MFALRNYSRYSGSGNLGFLIALLFLITFIFLYDSNLRVENKLQQNTVLEKPAKTESSNKNLAGCNPSLDVDTVRMHKIFEKFQNCTESCENLEDFGVGYVVGEKKWWFVEPKCQELNILVAYNSPDSQAVQELERQITRLYNHDETAEITYIDFLWLGAEILAKNFDELRKLLSHAIICQINLEIELTEAKKLELVDFTREHRFVILKSEENLETSKMRVFLMDMEHRRCFRKFLS